MLTVYLNYPNARVTIHGNPNCPTTHRNGKTGQRNIRLSLEDLSVELQKFHTGEYKFQSTSEQNDMWIELDFNDEQFESAVVYYIQKLLGNKYKPFQNSTLEKHC